MAYKSQVSRASSKSPSLRTTIPEKIVQEAKIRAGDVLDWEISSEKGRLMMKVKKLE
jgi:bifunctional DNA-binding transcriptional regulator/antitoxin component of YhaV-PrlF toxin-antitoxin module